MTKNSKPVHRSAPSIIQPSTNTFGGQTRMYKYADVFVDKDLEAFLGVRLDEEIRGLEENILQKGVEKPLDIWMHEGRRIVVDGFTRLRIARKHDLSFRITLREFKDKEEAKFWMIANQTDRRNLTTLHNGFLIGYEYNQLKKDSRSNLLQYIQPGSQNDTSVQLSDNEIIGKNKPQKGATTAPESQNDTSDDRKGGKGDSADLLALKYNIGRATIMRYSQVYQALVFIQKNSQEFYYDIIRERVNVTARDLEAFMKLEKKPIVSDETSFKSALRPEQGKQAVKGSGNQLSSIGSEMFTRLKRFQKQENVKNGELALQSMQKLQGRLEVETKKLEKELNKLKNVDANS